jgi:hypothetical protein
MRVVIPSLHYGDFLAVVLPAWQRMLPVATVTVVTSAADVESQAVARAARADLCVTDAWAADGAILNKAAAMDVAFGIAPGHAAQPTAGELCLALDADVYPVGTFPADQTFRPDALYGCPRYQCPSPADLTRHLRGKTHRAELPLIPPKVRGQSHVMIRNTRSNALASAQSCLGYFQLFRFRPGLAFGSYPSAGKYDLCFRDQFRTRVALWDPYVLHLGEQNRANWRGRVIGRWPEPAQGGARVNGH